MPQVKWLPEALADAERLHNFLHEHNPDAARRTAQAILNGAAPLTTQPLMGRPMDDGSGRREWFVSFGARAYVLRYMLDVDGTAVIIRVWQGREDRPFQRHQAAAVCAR